MFVMVWVALGITSFNNLNIERTPPMDFPLVTVTFTFPGASQVDIENLIVRRAEDAISEIAGLKDITSRIFENGAFVMAEFNFGLNVNDKAAEVKSKIDALAADFPDGMRSPVVEILDPMQEPVVDIVLIGNNPRDKDLFVRNVLSQHITAISGVASVSVFGGQERAIRIEIQPELIAARGAAISDIVAAISAANLDMPGGRIEFGRGSNNVRFTGEFASVEDISNLRISTAEGGNFALYEVATITDGVRDIETGARYNGENVVIVSVTRTSDGNAIRISRALNRNFPRFQRIVENYFRDSGDIPEMKIITDASVTIYNETMDTLRGIAVGIFFTIIILLIFTSNWRTTVIAAMVIPATLVAGFFFMDMAGFSVNVMTLLGMATSLGTLITSAIILIESALSRMRLGDTPEKAAVVGTKQAAVAVFAAIGTNVVVFLPIAFMGGIAGQFMRYFGLMVVYLTLISLVFSFTLTPMMIGKILKKTHAKPKKKKKGPSTSQWYFKFFRFQVQYPFPVIVLGLALLVGSAMLMNWVGDEFAPRTDTNEINIAARAPVGTTFEQSEAIAAEIESRVQGIPKIEYISTKIGERGIQNINIKLGLVPHETRRMSDEEIVRMVLPKLADIPDVEIQISAGEAQAGSANDLVIEVNGSSDERREAYARQILDILNHIPEVQSAILIAQEPGTEFNFVPDTAAMQFWGVSNRQAAVALRTALFGNDDLRFREGGDEFPIIIEFDEEHKTQAMLDVLFVSTPKGLVSLSSLGRLETVRATPDIFRRNKMRVTEIGINIGKSTMGRVRQDIEAELRKIDFTEGYSAVFGGMAETQDEMTQDIMAAFILAAILTYMLLAAIMNSYMHPFTVATSIILSFAGVFVALFLTGATLNIAALLALVMLVGIAVTNNILVVEPAVDRIVRGEEVTKALWSSYEAQSRTVIMTTLAIVAGMLPQLWSPSGMRVSMGAVIIGGMLASMFWTFAITPALFIVVEKLRTFGLNFKKWLAPAPAYKKIKLLPSLKKR